MRTNRLLGMLALALCLVFGTGCTVTVGQDDSQTPTVGDASAQADDASEVAQDPLEGIDASSRVVAVTRSVGELWLLAGGELTGVTDDALSLPGLNEDAETVGAKENPDVAQMMDLDPDLVLLPSDSPALGDVQQACDDAGVPVLAVAIASFDDYDAIMASLTAATERGDLYERNVTGVRSQIDKVVENTTQTEGGSYLALVASSEGCSALGEGSFVCAMLDDLGLTNATAASDTLTVDDVKAADPDWIFVIYQPEDDGAQQAFDETFAGDSAWDELAAAQRKRVVVLPQVLFYYQPNAKWGEAYAYLSQVFHGSWA